MIFKTFNSDIDSISSKWGVFGKSFNDISTSIENRWNNVSNTLQATNDYTISNIVNAWKSVNGNSISFLADDESIAILNQYNKALDSGAEATAKFLNAGTGNEFMDSFLKDLDGAPATMDKYDVAMKKATTQQKAFSASTIATKTAVLALNVAVSMGLSIALTALIKTITEVTRSEENMKDSARELGSEISNNVSSIEGYKKKIEELKGVLSDNSSSFDEVSQARVSLMEIQDELIDKFGTEKNVIEDITEAINGQTEALDELSRKSYYQAKNKFNEKTKGDKLTDWLTYGSTDDNRIQSKMDKMVSQMENSFYRLEKTGNDTFDSLIQNIFGLSTIDDDFYLSGSLKEIQEKLYGIQELSQDFDISTEFENSFTEISNDVDSLLSANQELYKQYVLWEKILTNDPNNQYDEQFNLINQAKKIYDDALKANDADAIQSASEKYAKVLSSAINLAMNNYDYDVADYFENIYPEMEQLFGEWKFKLNFEPNTDGLQDKVSIALNGLEGFSSEDILNFSFDTSTQNQISAYGELNSVAEQYGLTLQQLIDLLVQMGIVESESYQQLVDTFGQDNINKIASQDLVFAYQIENVGDMTFEEFQAEIQKIKENRKESVDLLSISSTIDQLNTKLKPAMDSLESAWNNIFTDDGFTLENIDLSTFESIKSKLDEMAELGLEVDTSSFENFVTVLNDTDSTAEQVKDAFDDLATSIVDAGVSGIEDFQLLKDTLQEMGVQNFEMVTFEELVKNTEALKAAGLDLVNATDVQIQAFAEEMVSAENAAQAYNLLLYAKELNNLAKMSTAGEVAELQNLAERAGVTGEIIQWLTRLQLVYQQVANRTLDPQTIQDYVFEAKELTAKIQNAATEVKFSGNEVDYKPLTKAASKAGKDAGKSYKDKLKDELSSIGDVLNYINDIIGDQIDLLGDQKDAAVDALNAEKEAAEAALQAQIDLVEAQIDAIEKQIEAKKKEIDKIKEAREERQREIDLQKKQFELLRMQNQKTSLIYKGEPGQFVYTTSEQGIRDARESLEEAKENIYIAGIEKEISLLEDEISNLEDVIDSLNNQIEASNKYYEDLIKSTENYYDGLIKNLEDYQNRWKEIGEIEEQAKIQVKLKELGITTEDILNMSEDAFNSFKQQYLAILTEMYSGEQDMIQAINDVANGIDVTTLTEGLNQTKENIDNLNEADFNSVSTGLNDISDGMGNVGTSASSASESTSSVSSDLQEMNTNAEGLDTKLSNISSALNDIPTSEKFNELATSFTNLGTAIQSVADALGISGEDSVSGLVTALTELGSFSLSGERGEGGIIEQFQNLKTAVDDVTSAINGGGSTGESASATNASGARTGSSMGTGNSTAGGGSGLTGAIKEIGTTTDETIGSGGEGEGTDSRGSEGEGVLGKFGQFKSAVEEVTKAIGTGEDEESGEEGATSLISALQLHYEKAEETLPEVKNMFEELLAKILECVSALGELAGAMSALGGEGFAFGTIGTGFASGTDPKASFTTTVGKAFAKGTDRFKGLDKDTLALRSEYNQSELTMYPDGKIELTNSPNLKVLPKNTKIFNEKQTQEMLNNKGTVVGNAYADGNAVLEKSSRFDNMRDLQPGDRMYDMFQKWNAYFEKNDHSFIEPVNAIQKNTEEIARSVSNVNTNNIQRSVNIGDIHITCPGVTSNEVAAQVSTELHKQIGGIALEVLQESHITR